MQQIGPNLFPELLTSSEMSAGILRASKLSMNSNFRDTSSSHYFINSADHYIML